MRLISGSSGGCLIIPRIYGTFGEIIDQFTVIIAQSKHMIYIGFERREGDNLLNVAKMQYVYEERERGFF